MFAGDTCRKQNLRERSRITSTHGSGVIHFQSSEYVRSREPFASLFIIFSYPEAGMKDFLCRTRMIKSGVVALQFPFLFFCEPVADAGEQFSFQLGIDLQMNRRLPVGSVSKSKRLLVPMKEAMRGKLRKFF